MRPIDSSHAAMASLPAPVPKRFRACRKDPSFGKEFRESLDVEDDSANQQVYLVTISRVLPGTVSEYRDLRTVTRAEVAAMVRDAFDDPLPSALGGRPRAAGDDNALIELVVVAQAPRQQAILKRVRAPRAPQRPDQAEGRRL